jgi:hypothetical protein
VRTPLEQMPAGYSPAVDTTPEAQQLPLPSRTLVHVLGVSQR